MKRLAVLLPTYNAASYINESIDSILNQTFKDFHLFIYDDFSSDDTENIVNSYHDNRIFYRKNKENLGIAKTLNRGLDELLKEYQFIARMDADDWSYPKRFEVQMKMFEEDTELIMCGTQGYWSRDFKSTPQSKWNYPIKYNALKVSLLLSASFGHSSVIFRSEYLLNNKIRYDESIKTCEDWELWTRILKLGKATNSSNFLMKYRILPQSNHRDLNNRIIHFKERSSIIKKQWLNFGFDVNREDLFSFYYKKQKTDNAEFKRILKYFINLFNEIDILELKKLDAEDQKYFRYRFTRNILNYWENSSISRSSLEIWLIILLNVKFINKIKLLKSLVR